MARRKTDGSITAVIDGETIAFTDREVDEIKAMLYNVNTGTRCSNPAPMSWAQGYQWNEMAQIRKRERRRADRLRALSATALGLYMRERMAGREGDVERRRLHQIERALAKVED